MLEILVADDPELLLALEDSFVRRSDCRILTVSDGVEALARARAARPQIVVLDARMPELSGFEVCRQIKAEPATAALPVILVGDGRDLPRMVEAGADGRVGRPVSAEDLLGTMRRLLLLAERAHPRRAASLRVDYYGQDREGTAYTGNLGAGGLFLKLREPLVAGEALQLIFDLPLDEPTTVRASGRVTRVVTEDHSPRPVSGVAIEFRDISPRDRGAISRFVGR